MNISIEELSRPIQSYSRTGRMAEAFQTSHQSVRVREKRTAKLDLSKMLSVAEVFDDDTSGAGGTSDEFGSGGGGGDLCSSAREHPSVSQKANYVVTAEKELAFAAAMRPLISPSATVAAVAVTNGSAAKPPTPAAAAGGGDRPLSPADALEQRMKALRAKLHKQERDRRQKTRPSPCFKTTGRSVDDTSVATGTRSPTRKKPDRGMPPVGHYHPRFDVVEQPVHRNVYFPKASRHLGTAAEEEAAAAAMSSAERRRGASSSNGGAGGLGSVGAGGAGGDDALNETFNKTVGSHHSGMSVTHNNATVTSKTTIGSATATKGAAATVNAASTTAALSATTNTSLNGGGRSASAMSRPTWPFLSRDSHMTPQRVPERAGTSLGPHDPVINRDLLENRKDTLKSFDFGKLVGRDKAQAVRDQQALDLFYNPKLAPFHAPALPFAKQVPRFKEQHLPRTAHDVETAATRLDISKFEKFKFSRQPVLADIKKHVSREAASNNIIVEKMKASVGTSELSDAPVYVPPFKTPTFKMRLIPGRKWEKPKPANDAQYEVSYAQVDKHWPNTKITGTPNRPMPGQLLCETVQIDVGAYRSDSPMVHKKIIANVDFGNVVSREKREHVTQGSLAGGTTATEVYDVRYEALDKRVGGNPMIASHMSREKRMKVQSPTPVPTDKVYLYDVDKLYPPLKKGAVAFDKQVVREKHGGTYFANAAKAMLNPEHD